MASPQAGNTVQVHYTGRLEDGSIFDSSEGKEPLSFTLGSGQVIPGFEEAILSLEVGQQATTTIAPEQAYGSRRDDMVVQIKRDQLPPGIEPEPGQHFHLSAEDGTQVPVIVTAVSEEAVTFDANHPLAGKTLIFEITLVSVA